MPANVCCPRNGKQVVFDDLSYYATVQFAWEGRTDFPFVLMEGL